MGDKPTVLRPWEVCDGRYGIYGAGLGIGPGGGFGGRGPRGLDRVVGRGRNRRERSRNALSHGELEAIDQACKTLGGWRLWQCTLYVTLEPCPMCAGAIVNARIPRVVFGARDPKAGACGSVCNLFAERFNHHPAVTAGVLEEPCAQVLRDFFRDLRAELPNRRKWKRPE